LANDPDDVRCSVDVGPLQTQQRALTKALGDAVFAEKIAATSGGNWLSTNAC
jgi:hypothetical protein